MDYPSLTNVFAALQCLIHAIYTDSRVQADSSPGCDEDWFSCPGCDICYHFPNTKAIDFDESVKLCQDIGGILAEPWTKARNEDCLHKSLSILDISRPEITNGLYIGLRRANGQSSFLWESDGSTMFSHNYEPETLVSDESLLCILLILDKGKLIWLAMPCSYQTYYLCQRDKIIVTTIGTTEERTTTATTTTAATTAVTTNLASTESTSVVTTETISIPTSLPTTDALITSDRTTAIAIGTTSTETTFNIATTTEDKTALGMTTIPPPRETTEVTVEPEPTEEPYEPIKMDKSVSCPILEHPGVTLIYGSSRYIGSVVEVTCPPGYEYHDGTSRRSLVCLPGGMWSSPVPECTKIQCDNEVAQVPYDDKVTIECNKDQKLQSGIPGTKFVCTATGKFSLENTDCEDDNHCVVAPLFDNANLLSTDARVGANLTLECFLGHRFSDGSRQKQIQCLDTKEWSEDPVNKCLVVTCPPVPYIPNASTDTDIAIFGTTVIITCNHGYQFSDKTLIRNITCQDSGEWTQHFDDCYEIHCQPLPNIQNAEKTGSGTAMDTMITFTCDENYRFLDGYGSKTVVCTNLEIWNETLTDCGLKRCSPLLDIPNTAADKSNATEGITVTYFCHNGYHFDNTMKSTAVSCDAELNWKGYSSVMMQGCSPITCPDLPTKHNALPLTLNRVLWSRNIYSCSTGFKWENTTNPASIQCLPSAEWSMDNFGQECQILDCGPEPTVYNAWIKGENMTYNSSYTFTALRDYWFGRGIYERTTRCSEDERWLPEVRHAFPIECLAVPVWQDAIFNTTSTTPWTVVNQTCLDGFFINGGTQEEAIIVCNEQGDWVPEIGICEAPKTKRVSFEATEAPNAVNIGTIVTASLSVLFGIIIFIDITSHISQEKEKKKKRRRQAERRQRSRHAESQLSSSESHNLSAKSTPPR